MASRTSSGLERFASQTPALPTTGPNKATTGTPACRLKGDNRAHRSAQEAGNGVRVGYRSSGIGIGLLTNRKKRFSVGYQPFRGQKPLFRTQKPLFRTQKTLFR